MYGYPWAAEMPAADPIASLREALGCDLRCLLDSQA